MNSPLLAILFLTAFILFFGFFMLKLSASLGPKKKKIGTEEEKVKLSPYECGLPAEDKDSTNIPVKFYLTAILFIIFDIEIIFIYPWALTFKDSLRAGQGDYTFIAMGIFLFIFIFGLFWEIASKALDWE